ncbi:MAG: thermonuclease family protein [Oligoflexia bacterium]|nr:thermonuclease family protein [Oligoflexia bacterium]
MKHILLALAIVFSYNAYAKIETNDTQPQPERAKCQKDKPIGPMATVVSSYDGDTILVKWKNENYSVRLIGIDTPETHFMGQTQGKWGDLAAEYTSKQLPAGTQVRLELSPSICDSYGRALAHVFKGNLHINSALASEGLAANYCLYPSVDHCEKIGNMAKKAYQSRKGMFSENTELPYEFRRRVSGRTPTSLVGNIHTKEVYGPENQERVDFFNRVFFSPNKPLPAPYHRVD